jgi:hypothetical protein
MRARMRSGDQGAYYSYRSLGGVASFSSVVLRGSPPRLNYANPGPED